MGRWDESTDRRWHGGRCYEAFEERELLCGPRATPTPLERQDGLDIPAWGEESCCQGQRGCISQKNDESSFRSKNEGARIADVHVREGDIAKDNSRRENVSAEVTRENLCPGEDGNTEEGENGHVARRYAHSSGEDGQRGEGGQVREDEQTKKEDDYERQMEEDGHMMADNQPTIFEDGRTTMTKDGPKFGDEHIAAEHTDTSEGVSVVVNGHGAEDAEETGNDVQTTEAEEVTDGRHAAGERGVVPIEGSSSDHVSDGDIHKFDDRCQGKAEVSSRRTAGQDPRAADVAAQLCLGEDWGLLSPNEFHAPALWSRGRRGWTQGWTRGERMTKLDEDGATHRL